MKKIKLTKGKYAMVDNEDYDKINNLKWHTNSNIYKGTGRESFYAMSNVTKTNRIFMHRLIMNPPVKMIIDHIDGNGLNNQKNNLRIVTYRENQLNGKTHKEAAEQKMNFTIKKHLTIAQHMDIRKAILKKFNEYLK